MVKCPICLQLVSELKTNSHIVPRWIMRTIKTGHSGRYHKLGPGEVSVKQTDDKATIVCKDCEDGFTQDDTFSALFFRDSRFLVSKDDKTEVHSEKGKTGLFRFLIGLCLRTHLFQEVSGQKGFLNDLYEPLRAIYFHRAVTEISFIAITQHFTYLANKVSSPTLAKENGFTFIVIHIFGYHFQLILAGPKNELHILKQLRTSDLLVIVDHSEDNMILGELRNLYGITKVSENQQEL